MSYAHFRQLTDFEWSIYRYYFFTIKPHGSVALRDSAHDMVKLIRYVGQIVESSDIDSVVYAFELDTLGQLHVHGIAQSLHPLQYNRLYRSWGVHHHFKEMREPSGNPRFKSYGEQATIYYILKHPVGPVIKTLKENDESDIISNYAYWYNINEQES